MPLGEQVAPHKSMAQTSCTLLIVWLIGIIPCIASAWWRYVRPCPRLPRLRRMHFVSWAAIFHGSNRQQRARDVLQGYMIMEKIACPGSVPSSSCQIQQSIPRTWSRGAKHFDKQGLCPTTCILQHNAGFLCMPSAPPRLLLLLLFLPQSFLLYLSHLSPFADRSTGDQSIHPALT